MQQNLIEYITNYKNVIEEELHNHFHQLSAPSRLKDSMQYSLEAGGKRIRPVLLFATYEAYGNDYRQAISPALAVEMIHTYSLIHDDLPAMDDDDYRRGKLTNHKVFDEATAILAGDALLTYSFEIICNDPRIDVEKKLAIIQLLAKTAGPKGMVGGQMLDMEAEKREVTVEELEKIHALKTGELLQFSVLTGGILGGASVEQLEHLKEFSYYLGLIFQIQDDILDVTGDEDKLGKPVGSDIGNEKSTYPSLLGLKGAVDMKNDYVNKAITALEKAGAKDSYLLDLTHYISRRES